MKLLQCPLSESAFFRQIAGIAAVCLMASATPTLAQAALEDAASREVLAETLDGVEDVQAEDSVLANAAPDSLEGKLYAYQQARIQLERAVEAQNTAYMTYQDIVAATADGSFFTRRANQAKIDDAARVYNALQQEAEAAQVVTQAALARLSDNAALSYDAMVELHAMLGL